MRGARMMHNVITRMRQLCLFRYIMISTGPLKRRESGRGLWPASLFVACYVYSLVASCRRREADRSVPFAVHKSLFEENVPRKGSIRP